MATATQERGRVGRPPRFYTVEEVAPMFRTSPKSIYRWAKNPSNALSTAARKNVGGGVLFEADRVDQLVELVMKGLLE